MAGFAYDLVFFIPGQSTEIPQIRGDFQGGYIQRVIACFIFAAPIRMAHAAHGGIAV